MGGSDRALMLAVPGLAILAAFALPTLQRSTGAAIDWFSVFFFSISALTIWVIYLSMQTGLPAQPMINITRLAPGYQSSFSLAAALFGAAGTLAWLWLVRWRSARHRHPLWKSLVLPASGVALAWLLTMTLLLPVLDYARSTRPLVQQIAALVPVGQCLRAPGLSRTHIAGLEIFGHYHVDGREGQPADALPCDHLLQMSRQPATTEPAGWRVLARLRRPADRSEYFTLYRREP